LIRIDREVNSKKRYYTETSYYISSLSVGADEFNKGIRAHWGIENKLHWVKDVTFGEDGSQVRTGYGPENMSIIRNITINILRKNGYKKLKQATRLLANDIPKIASLLE
jgi:predicted transposase YbfD/YdcC